MKSNSKYIVYGILILIIIAVGIVVYVQISKTTPAGSEEYNPDINPANFVSEINNPYYSLTLGTIFTYQGETSEGTEKIIVEVTNQTKKVLGITARVVWDRVWLNDELIEETYDWYAQDKEGNVWYLGEDSQEYENGRAVSTAGSWEAGIDGAKPGIIMKTEPKIGDSYRQEYYQGEAEDMADIIALSESVTVPSGEYKNCLKTKDWSQIERNLNEYKYYCPAVGNVVLEEVVGGGEKVELVDVKTSNVE